MLYRYCDEDAKPTRKQPKAPRNDGLKGLKPSSEPRAARPSAYIQTAMICPSTVESAAPAAPHIQDEDEQDVQSYIAEIPEGEAETRELFPVSVAEEVVHQVGRKVDGRPGYHDAQVFPACLKKRSVPRHGAEQGQQRRQHKVGSQGKQHSQRRHQQHYALETGERLNMLSSGQLRRVSY